MKGEHIQRKPLACWLGLHLWKLTIGVGQLQPHRRCERCGEKK